MHILRGALRLLLLAACYLIALAIAMWTAGAIYYDVGRGRWFAAPLTLLWLAAVVAGFYFWKPTWQPLIDNGCGDSTNNKKY